MSQENIPDSNQEKQKQSDKKYDFENTTVEGQLYNVEILEHYAEQIEPQEIPLEDLRGQVSENNFWWTDKNGEKLGPYQILRDWEAAQKNPAWVDHIEGIRHANLSNPIWMGPDGIIFNGVHRLTRAFLEGVKTINVRKFNELPSEAIVKD